MNLDPTLFGGEFLVVIRDLSGGNGSEPVERVRGFASQEHANEFARRYVRDSLERCRARGMSAEQVSARGSAGHTLSFCTLPAFVFELRALS